MNTDKKMKATLLLITLICTAVSITSWRMSNMTTETVSQSRIQQNIQNVVSTGSIGDVKYSVLPPDKFREENGEGWVLMDDKVPIQGSVLESKHGITEIPDVRGLFIRSLNGVRSDNKADPYYMENRTARLLGSYQDDALKSHNHAINVAGVGIFGNDFQNLHNVLQGDTRHPTIHYNNTELDNGIIVKQGSYESRPRNIALYTYVKIND